MATGPLAASGIGAGPGATQAVNRPIDIIAIPFTYSAAIAPMCLQGRAIGAIGVGRGPPRPFSARERALLEESGLSS